MPKAAKKAPPAPELEPGIVTELPLATIELDPDQPRKDVPQEHIDALAADIKQSRVKQPITVRPDPEKPGSYIIRYGECRYRASLQARKKTIPCLLDTEEDTQGDPLARLLDQVKENHIRRDLNPMEWAGVLRRMRKDHSIKSINAIEDTLKGHGITNMGRAQISNLMRLQELPDWAQELIRAGRLTAAHGKHLLTAQRSERVTEALRAALVDEGEDLSVRALQERILNEYRSAHIILDGYWQPFDYKTECAAAGCQKMRKISTEADSGTFCLDRQCYKAKEEAACDARAKAREERLSGDAPEGEDEPREYVPPQVDQLNCVDTDAQPNVEFNVIDEMDLDTTECQTCEHCHYATWKGFADGEPRSTQACFAPTSTCFEGKVDERARWREAQRDARNMIEAWLREILPEPVLGSESASFALMASAAFLLDGMDAYELEDEDATGIHNIGQLFDFRKQREPVIRRLIACATPEILVPLALFLDVDLTQWRLSDDVLDHFDREDLEAFVRNCAGTLWPQTPPDELETTLAQVSDDEIRRLLLNHAEEIKPPQAVQTAWERLTQQYTDQEEAA